MPLPPHLARIVEAEYPRFSAAEMARHRAAVEALLPQAQCDHLIFCGANRVGSIGAISHAMAGDRRGGRRVHAGPSATRCSCNGSITSRRRRCWPTRPTSPGAASRRLPWRLPVLAKRGARRDRVASIGPLLGRAARRHCREVRRAEESQPPLHAAPAGQIGGGNRLAAHRRAFHRSRHDRPARRARRPA